LTGRRPLREPLIEIAEFAVQAIPAADGAGLTMLEDERAQTVVASAEFVRVVDDVQYVLSSFDDHSSGWTASKSSPRPLGSACRPTS
jgi:hypothetical protein